MLKSYEAIYENGQVKWLGEQPSVQSARVIVTVLEETASPAVKRRTLPTDMTGKVQISGDIVSPILAEEDVANAGEESSQEVSSLLSMGGSQPSLQQIPPRRLND